MLGTNGQHVFSLQFPTGNFEIFAEPLVGERVLSFVVDDSHLLLKHTSNSICPITIDGFICPDASED